jgi:hypothetical protein
MVQGGNLAARLAGQTDTPSKSQRSDPIEDADAAWPVTDPDGVAQELAGLADTRSVVSLHGDGAGEPTLARVRSLHDEDPWFEMELYGPAPAGALLCVAVLNGSKIQFRLEKALEPVEGVARFRADFPSKCLILNRRAAPRVEAPLGPHYSASFILMDRKVELPLHDFSIGGVGLRAGPRQAAGLHVGKRLERARLELGRDAIVVVDLEVRLARKYRSFLLGEQVQIGCQFKNLFPSAQQEIERCLAELSKPRS